MTAKLIIVFLSAWALAASAQPAMVTGTGGGFRHARLRAGLVVCEVALSIVLLVGAG